jgi:hypothetical protein
VVLSVGTQILLSDLTIETPPTQQWEEGGFSPPPGEKAQGGGGGGKIIEAQHDTINGQGWISGVCAILLRSV